ncbi:MAG: zf-HC2 domain-containing protein [Thermoanaerobaculales bacterium]|nr:zf-HC2 domain-containing protein [Thermoanaerobaculales bacterium]
MDCRTFLVCLEDYLSERLEDSERLVFREHFSTCSSCRSAAIAADPSFLLVPVHPEQVDERAVRACTEAVSLLINQDRLRRRLVGPRRWWLAAAAALLVTLSGGLLWRMAPAVFPVGANGAALQAEAAAETAEPPQVEVEMLDDNLRIYQYTDAGDENTAVYFVVSEGLEL